MNLPSDSLEPTVDLPQLLQLFYAEESEDAVGSFTPVEGEQMPPAYRALLDHHSHMTVAVESHFDSPVDVVVEQACKNSVWYSREILLRTQRTGETVQYGIVRLRYGVLAPSVWQEIEAGNTPLGRVLIQHNVLRHVELIGLWQVTCGPVLAKCFAVSAGTITYGRTARIFCDSEPAIELLEIIRPGE